MLTAIQRKKNNITQEQLAGIFGISRQAISKWESNLAYPETDKIIKMSELFHCSTDYLLKDEIENENNDVTYNRISNDDREYDDRLYDDRAYGDRMKNERLNDSSLKYNRMYNDSLNDDRDSEDREKDSSNLVKTRFIYGGYSFVSYPRERKSKKMIHGVPLWHVGKNAKGIIAVGLKAQGVISVGLFSIGVLSFGLFSLGLVALGVLALGLFASGSISVGVISLGAVSFGIVSVGACAIGKFSFGASAIGDYIAIGDSAKAMIAIGQTKASGSLYEYVGDVENADIARVRNLLSDCVPSYLQWAKKIFEILVLIILSQLNRNRPNLYHSFLKFYYRLNNLNKQNLKLDYFS